MKYRCIASSVEAKSTTLTNLHEDSIIVFFILQAPSHAWVLFYFKPMKQEQSKRNLMQLIRRKMITKIKPSGKVYDRKKENKFNQ